MPRDDGPGAGALTEAEVHDLISKEYEKLNRYCRGRCVRGGVGNPLDQDDVFSRTLELTLRRARRKDEPWFAAQSDIPRVAALWVLFKVKFQDALREHRKLRPEGSGEEPSDEDLEGEARPDLFIEAAGKKYATEVEGETEKRWLLWARTELPKMLDLLKDPVDRFVITALISPGDVSEKLVRQVANHEPKNQKAKFFRGDPAKLWEAVRNLPCGDEEFDSRKQQLVVSLGVEANTLEARKSRATKELRLAYERRAARKAD